MRTISSTSAASPAASAVATLLPVCDPSPSGGPSTRSGSSSRKTSYPGSAKSRLLASATRSNTWPGGSAAPTRSVMVGRQLCGNVRSPHASFVDVGIDNDDAESEEQKDTGAEEEEARPLSGMDHRPASPGSGEPFGKDPGQETAGDEGGSPIIPGCHGPLLALGGGGRGRYHAAAIGHALRSCLV
jgi:hypothetical protein